MGKSVISKAMMDKANRIVKKGIIEDKNNVFQIPSDSNPELSYIVTKTQCQCKGFRTYAARNPKTTPTCSHIIAIEIFKNG